jgi:hypothetical protein
LDAGSKEQQAVVKEYFERRVGRPPYSEEAMRALASVVALAPESSHFLGALSLELNPSPAELALRLCLHLTGGWAYEQAGDAVFFVVQLTDKAGYRAMLPLSFSAQEMRLSRWGVKQGRKYVIKSLELGAGLPLRAALEAVCTKSIRDVLAAC